MKRFSFIFRFSFIAFLGIIFIFSSCKKESSKDIKYWYDNIGSRTDLAFLPDSAANYFTYSFTRKKGDKTIIKLKGEFPYARYFS